MRNLTALEVLDMVRREITQPQIQAAATPVISPSATASVMQQVGDKMVSSVDGMTLFYIPADEFEMGSTSGNPDSEPIHTVSLVF